MSNIFGKFRNIVIKSKKILVYVQDFFLLEGLCHIVLRLSLDCMMFGRLYVRYFDENSETRVF